MNIYLNKKNVIAFLLIVCIGFGKSAVAKTSIDRGKYKPAGTYVGKVWCLSIGIDDYKSKLLANFLNCESDAQSYNSFFKKEYKVKLMGDTLRNFNEYLLLGEKATKKAIIDALKDIASKASFDDYFIFNFSGYSTLHTSDSTNFSTYFFPFSNSPLFESVAKKNIPKDVVDSQLISLRTLQEYIQLIPANNQLFISEAGPSEKFKTEFIKSLMQNSPAVASLLNKNRVIIVPNGFGADDVKCEGNRINKGPINYYITSLDASENIYDLFKPTLAATRLAYKIKSKEISCASFSYNYFDIFFEKQFLQQYKEIFGDEDNQTRGLKTKPKELQQTISNLTAKKYALVVGTDNYKGKGWNKLSNPIKDARAVADELYNSYGFDVQLMEDKPIDSIYKAIREYYRIAEPNDQLVVYFAGHGDVDNELLDDGFIVCTDSKSIDDDPVRNTYIPYTKLQKMLNNIPARQVLVLLDVCHGGTFDAKAFDNVKRETSTASISNKNVLQFLKDKLPLRTRKFLSSVGSEPAFDGKAGRHSPFANLLLQVLRARGEGTNGIVTLGDINAVLQTASLNETATLK
ncbi:MAG: caspase family protein, partial [Chitinophagaceae bacterium]